MGKANNSFLPPAGDARRIRLFRILSVLLGLAAAFGLLILVESGAVWFLSRNGLKTYPLFIHVNVDKGPEAVSPMFVKDIYSAFDPQMGYAHNPEYTPVDYKSLPGFTIYGEGQGKTRTLVIVTLGGSTTDGIVPHIWAQALQEIMASHGINVQVYNGGVAGFSSSQELLKLIRDVIPLKPDLVISLNGINDVGVRDVLPKHPMVNSYQEAIMKYLTEDQPPAILPNTMTALQHMPWLNEGTRIKRAINYGPNVISTPAENWDRNIRLMWASSVQFGIQYLCVLQPTLGIGAYGEMSAEEKDMFKNVEGEESLEYMKLVQDFYDEARPDCSKKDYCIDLVDVFDGQSGLYVDKMHTNDLGNRMVAQAVYDALLERYPGLKQNLLQ